MLLRRSCPVPAARRPPWHRRARTAVAAPVGRYLSGQAACPHGTVGRVLSRIWVRETAAVNDTAIELLNPAPGERICEIGFGPGRTLGRLAAAGAEVVGVDVSPVMVAAAVRRNARSVAAGRIRLYQGDGTTLPVADGSLDAGRIVLALRAGEHPLPARFDPAVYRVPTTTGATGWLHAAGFAGIGVHRRPHIAAAVVWVTATAT